MMKHKMRILVFLLTLAVLTIGDNVASAESIASDVDEIRIVVAGHVMIMPVNYIILAKPIEDDKYCAIKFLKMWDGKHKDERYAEYVSYYQPDGSGDLLKSNVIVKRDVLKWPRLIGIGWFSFAFGANYDISCGDFDLAWFGGGTVYFDSWKEKQKSLSKERIPIVELAPTPWENLEEVDVYHNNLKWYRFNDKRKRKRLPVNKLMYDDKPE
jgi:hypothetical protein